MLNGKKTIIFIFFFTVIIRFLYVYYFSGFTTLPGMDEIFYDKVAVNIVDGLGFVVKEGIPTTKKPPIYPYFLALIYFLFGKGNFLALKITQIFIGGICSVLIYFIAKRLANEKIAIIASILTALDPFLIFASSWVLAHIMVYFFIALAVLFCLKTIENPTLSNQILSGILWGLVGLSMGYNTFLFYPYLFIWGLIVFWQDRKKALKIAATLFLAVTLTISIWTIRNYMAYKKIIPIVTNGGYRFRGSNNPRANGLWTPSSGSPRFYTANENRGWGNSKDWESWAIEADYLWLDLLFSEKKEYNDYEVNRINYKAGWNWIKENPVSFLKLLPQKFYHFWEPLNRHSTFPQLTQNIRSMAIIFYCSIFPLFIFGIYLSIKNWKNYLIIYLTAIHSIIGALIYYGDAQQRMIIAPFLSIFAAVTLNMFIDKLKKTKILNRRHF
ncbi:MAG: glycosyltransferase family 39 protein [bacterium]